SVLFLLRVHPTSTLFPYTTLFRSNELGFDGLVMTDDLDMGAILTGYRLEETIRLATAAGNDVAMICHRIPEIENVQRIVATLPQDRKSTRLNSSLAYLVCRLLLEK